MQPRELSGMPQRPAILELHRRSSDEARILLVDANEPWRTHVRSFFRREAEWTIVSDASDGLEACSKAVELHPEIILLDLNTPRLNGIEAAKKIRNLSPIQGLFFSLWKRTRASSPLLLKQVLTHTC